MEGEREELREGGRKRGREVEREGGREVGRREEVMTIYHYDYWLDSADDGQPTVIIHNNIIHDNESNNATGSHTQSDRTLCLV